MMWEIVGPQDISVKNTKRDTLMSKLIGKANGIFGFNKRWSPMVGTLC